MQSTRWVYTLNNYTAEEETNIQGIESKYHVYGRELGERRTPHLQGFIIFANTKRLAAVRRLIPRAHWEKARGTSQQAADYAKKDGNFWEQGEVPAAPNDSDRWEQYYKAAEEGRLDDIPAGLRIRYRSAFKGIEQEGRVKRARMEAEQEFERHPLRQWQAELQRMLEEAPNDRTIIWVVDIEGNKGKSWFASYLSLQGDCQVFKPAKSVDIAYDYDVGNKVVVFDIPRSRSETMQWDVIENIKDGRLFSSKYEPITKRFKPPHVVVLANIYPPHDAFSADRLKIMDLS